MPDETLHDVMVRVGLVRARPRPLPQSMRAAWETTPEATTPYAPPRQALNDPNTIPYQRPVLPQTRETNRELAQLADRQSLGGPSGHADGREAREFGQSVVEATGIPSWARGIEDLQYNNPGDALPEIAMGGLQTGSLAFLPFDAAAAARAPRAPMGYRPPRLPPLAAEAPRSPNAPPRLPGRATDGSVLPIRPPEPIRQSMVGGSDDLMDAARSNAEQWDGGYYHASPYEFDAFDPNRSQHRDHIGTFFSPSEAAVRGQYGNNIYHSEIRAGRYITPTEFQRRLQSELGRGSTDVTELRRNLIQRLQAEGYLGIRGHELDEVQVFNSARDARIVGRSRYEPPVPAPLDPIAERARALMRSGMRPSEARAAAEAEAASMRPQQAPDAGSGGAGQRIATEQSARNRYNVGDTKITYEVLRNGDIEISLVRTNAEAQGRGSARRALEEFLARPEVQGRRISLVADPQERFVDAERLAGFYESLGFRRVGARGEMVLAPPGRLPVRQMSDTAPQDRIYTARFNDSETLASEDGKWGPGVYASDEANVRLSNRAPDGGARGAGKIPRTVEEAARHPEQGVAVSQFMPVVKGAESNYSEVSAALEVEARALRRGEQYTEADVPVDSLTGTQPTVGATELEAYRANDIDTLEEMAMLSGSSGDDLPLVYRTQHGDFLIDGHHRAIAAMMRGERTIRADVVNGTTHALPDGGARGAGQTLDLERLQAEGWDTSQAWTRVVPDNAADPWEVRPLGRFGPGLYFGDATVAEQMTSRVNRIGARQGHTAASHRAYIRDGEMATEHEWRDAYQRNLRGIFGERTPQDAEARAVRELEGRGYIGVVIRDRNDGSMSLNVFRRENILPVPDAPNAGGGARAPDGGASGAGQFGRGMQQLRDEGFDVNTPLYHGTGRAFDEFDLGMAGERTGGERAIFLTTSPAVADSYLPGAFVNGERVPGGVDLGDGVARSYADGANVRPVYVRPENFERWDFGGAEITAADLRRVIKEARENGSPGVAISNVRDAGQYGAGPVGNPNAPGHIVIAFRPEDVTPRFPRTGRAPDAPNAGSGARAPSTGTPPKSYKALPRRTPLRPRPPQRPMR